MYALVEWIDEEKVSIITLTRIKEPRKDFDQYEVGDIVKASCHGFPGVHSAKILGIKGSSTDGKKQLEKMAQDYIAAKNHLENEQEEQTILDMTSEEATIGIPPTKRGRKSTTEKDDAPKRSKNQENKENKAEREKKKEEKKRQKEFGLKKNAAFLQSLDVFRQQSSSLNQQQGPAPENVATSTSAIHPQIFQQYFPSQFTQFNQHQAHSQQSHQHQIQQIHSDHLQQQSHFGFFGQLHSAQQPQQEKPTYTNLSLAEIPGMSEEISRGEKILEDFLEKTDSSGGKDGGIVEIEAPYELTKCKVALEKKEKELELMTRELLELRRELKEAKKYREQWKESDDWLTQCDGQPRAGIVPKEIAECSGMIELMPNSGVFVYPKDIRVVSKKTNGTGIARYLMSVFYKNDELIRKGNLTGANGKEGLNKQITKAIVDYAVIKGTDSEAAVKLSMRTKISALVSFEQKKTNSQC